MRDMSRFRTDTVIVPFWRSGLSLSTRRLRYASHVIALRTRNTANGTG